MKLTYRQRLIIFNCIDSVINQIQELNIPLNNDLNVIKEFQGKLLNNTEVEFKSSDMNNATNTHY